MHPHQRRDLTTAVVLGAMVLSLPAAAAIPSFSNGGAQYWVAFDPTGRDIGPVQFMAKRVEILNTSNAPNAVTVYYEPLHKTLCTQTLAPGAMTTCAVASTPDLARGYFQVIAAQPVLAGGTSDAAFMNFAQQPNGSFGAEPEHGRIFSVPLVFQQGCPPRPGSGCPDGRNVIDRSGATIERMQQPR
jgi:hypothetical protein